MTHWRIEQHYGFGAGKIALRPQLLQQPDAPDSLMTGLHRLVAHMRADGDLRVVTTGPLVLVTLLFFVLLGFNLLREPVDQSDIQVVMLRLPEEPPLPIPLETQPEPVVPEPELKVAEVEPPAPVPVVQRVEPPKPKPKPATVAPAPAPVVEPEQIVRREPRVVPKPKPRVELAPAPVVQMDALALSEPEPEPPRRTRRALESPQEAARRQIELAPVPTTQLAEQAPNPTPQRRARVAPQVEKVVKHPPLVSPVKTQTPEPVREAPAVKRVARAAPQPHTAARPKPAMQVAPAPTQLLATADVREPRARQKRSFTPAKGSAKRPPPSATLAPMVASAELPDESAEPVRRARRATPEVPQDRRPRPEIAASPALASTPAARDPEPQTRTTQRSAKLQRPAPGSARSFNADSVATPRVSGPATAEPSSGSAGRLKRVAQLPEDSSSRAGGEHTLSAVSLGSLAACISDAEEDSLKQQLIAAVTTQEECSSSAGLYRFVETKNLNAFLMWIQRAPNRPETDRCGELRLALECLAKGGGR